jgi:hypothetical protein
MTAPTDAGLAARIIAAAEANAAAAPALTDAVRGRIAAALRPVAADTRRAS